MEPITRSIQFSRVKRTVKAEDGQPMEEVVFIASTAAVDSYDDIVVQDWDLSRYNANPVVQADHSYSVDSTIARGRAFMDDGPDGKPALHLAIEQWSSRARAQEIRADVEAGILSAVSVGFQSLDPVRRSSLPPEDPAYQKDGYGYIHRKNLLLEVSIVAIPANAEALKLSAAPAAGDLSAALEDALKKVLPAIVDNVAQRVLSRDKVARELAEPATPAKTEQPKNWFDSLPRNK